MGGEKIEMKKIRILPSLMTLLVLAIACFIPLASAVQISIADPIHVSGNGSVWYVDTFEATDAFGNVLYSFTADEIVDVRAEYVGLDGSVGNVILAKHTVINANKVQLQFDLANLPKADEVTGLTCASSGIIITLANTDIIVYSGPGFTSSFRPR